MALRVRETPPMSTYLALGLILWLVTFALKLPTVRALYLKTAMVDGLSTARVTLALFVPATLILTVLFWPLAVLGLLGRCAGRW